MRAILLDDIDQSVPFGVWRGIDALPDLLGQLMGLAIDVLTTQPRSLDDESRALTILYEVLFYNQLGSERTHKGWPLEKSSYAIFSFNMDNNTDDDLYMISLLRSSLFSKRCLCSLPADGKATLALCPDNARAGDKVAIVLGCQYPVVLRPEKGHYQVVGEALVHGYMDGDVVSKLPEVDITLV